MPHINISLIPILAKIAIFVILANSDLIFRGEEVEIAKSDSSKSETSFQELFEYVIRFGKSSTLVSYIGN